MQGIANTPCHQCHRYRRADTGLCLALVPPGLLEMARAGRLLATLAAVDLVMGPLLTLVEFKPGKKSLKFDLTAIALLQAGALLYGLHAVW